MLFYGSLPHILIKLFDKYLTMLTNKIIELIIKVYRKYRSRKIDK